MSYNGSTIDSKPVCGGSIPSILELIIDLVLHLSKNLQLMIHFI